MNKSTPNVPTQEEIAQRAQEIWLRSGQVEGRDEQNWFQAEKELTRERASASTSNGRNKETKTVVSPASRGSPQLAAR